MTKRSSVADYLQDFERNGPACAYIQPNGYRTLRWSYAQVAELAVSFARELHSRNIIKGDRVMLWGEDCAQWVAAFFGCAIAGVVVVPMDNGAAPDFARRVFQQVEAKLLVCSQAHATQHVGEVTAAESVITFDDISQSAPTRNPGAKAKISRDDPLQIVFTSGTTAEPRGVVISHDNVLANVAPIEEQIRGYLKYERLVHPVRFLNLLPLSHVFGQFLGMFLPPILGGTVVFQETLKPSEIVRTIRRERVSVLVTVPRVLQSLKQKIERDVEDRGRKKKFEQQLRYAGGKHFLRRWWIFRPIRRQFGWKFWAFISGGAALDRDTEEFWDRLGYAVVQGYGLTETTSLISVNHPFRLGKGSIGKVLAGREVKLADDGEILVRGGGVARGFLEQSKEASESPQISDEESWYHTGDVGAFDEQGNLFFKGRKKEVIVTPAGTNVYPEDLEAALRRQPEVKDCVVVGIERDGNAEPCAVLILRDQASTAEVIDRANHSLAEYQKMRLWLQWPQEDFPRTSTQKPKRNLIRDVARAQIVRTAPSSDANSQRPLLELISRIARRPITSLPENARLDSDLGLSSLDRVELLSALEDRYQLDLSDTGFSTVATVADLEKTLRGENVDGAVYHYPYWALNWPATWLRFLAYYLLLRPAVLLLGWPRIEGRRNLRGRNGPFLVISNHIADVDVGFLLTALPARIRHRLATATGGEALEALRTPPADRNFLQRIFDRIQWGFGVCLLNLFPLPREAGFRHSFEFAGEAVDHGYSILVFPEGHHTTDGNLKPFRAGIGLLAKNLAIPLLPMRIDGLYELKQAGKKFALPGQITVRIGKPVEFDSHVSLEQVARELEQRVREL